MMDAMSMLLNVVVFGFCLSTLSLVAFSYYHGPGVSWLDRAVKVWAMLAVATLALSTLLRFLRMEE